MFFRRAFIDNKFLSFLADKVFEFNFFFRRVYFGSFLTDKTSKFKCFLAVFIFSDNVFKFIPLSLFVSKFEALCSNLTCFF